MDHQSSECNVGASFVADYIVQYERSGGSSLCPVHHLVCIQAQRLVGYIVSQHHALKKISN